MMERVQNYQDLIVWQKAMDLAEMIYSVACQLPKEERFVLSDQMRRAAVSIPSNIAEGNSRHSTKDYVRFLSIARGSNAELQTQMLLCVRLHFLQTADVKPVMTLSEEIGKMLNALIRSLTPKLHPQS
jgi:four helix bundle protein